MKNMTLVFLIVLLMTMTGCARVSKPSKYAINGYTSNPDWSFARNVSTAAGLPDIDDIEIDEKARRELELKDYTALEATVFSSMAYLSDLNQLGYATLPLSFVAWSVINQPTTDFSKGKHFFAWMPRSMAKTTEEAIDVHEEILKHAFDIAIKNVHLSDPYYFVLKNPVFYKTLPNKKSSATRISYRYVIKGGVCDKQSCSAGFYFTTNAFDGQAKPYPGVAPDFLGGDAWVFTRYTVFRPTFPRFMEGNGEFESKIITPTITAIAKQLPPWIFLYINDLAPDAKHTFPAVLNQDKAYLYIKPQPEDKL